MHGGRLAASGCDASLFGGAAQAGRNAPRARLCWSIITLVRRAAMAKGQVRKNKEARKPKAEKKKTIAANPSTKGTVLGTKG
jgi:hypothetical protein